MEPMIVAGMKRMGNTIPETTPNRAMDSALVAPARINITGSKTAIAELTKEVLARTEVRGRVALNNGFNCFFGEESRPPLHKKYRTERLKEKR